MNNNRGIKKPVIITKSFDGRIDRDGTPDGVLVSTYDCCVQITLEDAEDGREMTWDEAVKKYGEFLPDRKQAALICMYFDEINAALTEAGGRPLKNIYWTSSEVKPYTAMVFCDDTFWDFLKTNKFRVRPVIQF